METVFTKNMTEYHIDSSSESGPIQVGCAADFVVGPRSIHFVVPFEIIRLDAYFCDLASKSNDRVHLLHRASPDHFLANLERKWFGSKLARLLVLSSRSSRTKFFSFLSKSTLD